MTDDRNRDLLLLLADVVHWEDRIALHIASTTREQFSNDPAKIDAVCWCIACIGEAAGKIRQGWPNFAAVHPELELANAYAMRNRIAHGYHALDVGIVWQTSNEPIPRFVRAARASIADIEIEGSN